MIFSMIMMCGKPDSLTPLDVPVINLIFSPLLKIYRVNFTPRIHKIFMDINFSDKEFSAIHYNSMTRQ